DVVGRFLHHHGFEAEMTRDPHEAIGRVAELSEKGRWPVLLTPLDTAGEKPYEEFVGEGETVRRSRFGSLDELGYVPPADPESFPELVSTVRSMLSEPVGPQAVTVDRLRNLIARVEPAFAVSHRSSAKSLDQRM